MWRATNPDGALLYPTSSRRSSPSGRCTWCACSAASLYLVGFVLMAWNLTKTARAGKAVNGQATVDGGGGAARRARGPAPAGWSTRPGFLFVLAGGGAVLSSSAAPRS